MVARGIFCGHLMPGAQNSTIPPARAREYPRESANTRAPTGQGRTHVRVRSESYVIDYPFEGMSAYAEPWFRRLVYWLDGPEGASGVGRTTVEMVVPAALAGVDLYHQFYILDPGAPYGWACSNGLEILYR